MKDPGAEMAYMGLYMTIGNVMPQGLFLVLIVHLKIFMKSQVKAYKMDRFYRET
jgi:hypothetical protein